jgi:hypothetical protein
MSLGLRCRTLRKRQIRSIQPLLFHPRSRVRDRDKTGLTIADIPDDERVIIRNVDEEQYVSDFYPLSETELRYERYNSCTFTGAEIKKLADVLLQPSRFGTYQIFGDTTGKNYGRYDEKVF